MSTPHASEALVIRPAVAADAEAIVRAQRTLLDERAQRDEEGLARALALRRWAYERNPAGARSFLALHDGRPVAHYGAWPLRALWAGREVVLAQPVDSFAVRAWQGRGAFVATARAFFAAYGGALDAAYFGWPVEAAWRAGRRSLGYEAVHAPCVLASDRALAQGALPLGIAPVETFDHQVRWLFDRCAGEWPLAVVRDDSFYEWRFAARPHARYRALGARDAQGVLRALAVWTHAPDVAPRAFALVDWLVPPQESELGARLLAACEVQAQGEGAGAGFAWLPLWSGACRLLQRAGWRVRPSPYVLAARSFRRGIDADLFREGWWSTLAESDLV